MAFIARTKLLATDEGFALDDFETTAEIAIPDDPLKRVVGQDEAVKLARIAANQRRHFLLVGPPGTGKSMIAQALSLHLPSVTEVPVRELVETLKNAKQTRAVVFDGIITQRILDIAAEMNMHSVVGTKMGTITKQPAGVVVWTRSDLAP